MSELTQHQVSQPKTEDNSKRYLGLVIGLILIVAANQMK